MGKLTLLSVPIGNLGDLTKRVQEALEEGKKFVVEDSRSFIKLLNLLGISSKNKEILTYHDQSGENELAKIVARLKQGENLFYVSEAGSPIASDPAFPLVRKCWEDSILVDSYPGACSIINALELSGLPPIPFVFHGFIPRESNKKEALKNKIKNSGGTHILYESPHRVHESLSDLCQSFPDAWFCVARELTKMYQSCVRFKGSELDLNDEGLVNRGEFTLLIFNPKESLKQVNHASQTTELAHKINRQGARPKLVAKLVAQLTGENSSEIYNRWLADKRTQ